MPGRALLLCLAVALAGPAATSSASSAAPASHPMRTAIVDPTEFTGPNAEAAFARTAASGASFVRLMLKWNDVLAEPTKPRGFDPTDPENPAFNWTVLDKQVQLADAAGLQAFIYVVGTPAWEKRGKVRGTLADPGLFGKLGTAVARHYDGTDPDLPRVRYWMVWNEPNHRADVVPAPPSALWYRNIVNAFAKAVHAVNADNIVIAGGLSPFKTQTSVSPLTFMRQMLCMSKGANPKPTCNTKVEFDVWSHHPYTSGGPTHHANNPNDVSLGDLPEMHDLLQAAIRAGHVVSTHQVEFWVTEFSWDSSPPDPLGVPAALEGRWVAEALYRAWAAGASMFTWFRLRDDPLAASPYQCGLYFRGTNFAHDRPKPALTAFRFPFVALQQENGSVLVWGRTPASDAQTVLVEQRIGAGWKRVAELHSDSSGIFTTTLQAPPKGFMRARLVSASDVSLPFSLKAPPDHYYRPFGS